MSARKCNHCKFCVLQDTGYSNYTVDGTDVTCMKAAHPNPIFDYWYGDSEHLNWAKNCNEFKQGEPLRLYVEDRPGTKNDPVESFTDDPEQLHYFKGWVEQQ